MSFADVHGAVEHADQNDPVFDRSIEQNEAVDDPASKVRGKFGTRASHRFVAGEHFEFLVEEAYYHVRVLGTAFRDVCVNGGVVLFALCRAKDCGHGLIGPRFLAMPR